MKSTLLLMTLAWALSASGAAAQTDPAVAASTVSASTASYGIPLEMTGGPWVIAEALFLGRQAVSEYSLRDRIRARPNSLFTPSDIAGDLRELAEMPVVESADAKIYGIPDRPVPDHYRTIAVSTMMVRIVYTIREKEIALPGLGGRPAPGKEGEAAKDDSKMPPVSLSGVVITPTAYRGIGQYNRPGLAFDINYIYFIGRLYGKNDFTTQKTNYIDRIGVSNLTFNGKMQIQSESTFRPAAAAGMRGIFGLRDAPQPSLQSANTTVDVNADTTRIFTDAYFVMSKKIKGLRASLGYARGNAAERISMVSEFLNEDALKFIGHPGQGAFSKDQFFGSLLILPKPSYPLAVEFVKPNGMPLNPILFNFKLGHFLKLNFDLSYLRFQGGWDLLGTFQFRYTYYPRTRPRKSK